MCVYVRVRAYTPTSTCALHGHNKRLHTHTHTWQLEYTSERLVAFMLALLADIEALRELIGQAHAGLACIMFLFVRIRVKQSRSSIVCITHIT